MSKYGWLTKTKKLQYILSHTPLFGSLGAADCLTATGRKDLSISIFQTLEL